MSSGPKTRGSYGPTSPRGQYSRSMAAPGMSLDKQDAPKGAKPKGMKKGGMATSASRRADGIAKKGKTRCKMV